MAVTLVKGESNIINQRVGFYKGQKSIFSTRNPKTGEVYGEDLICDIVHGNLIFGKWVDQNEVVWLDPEKKN